MLTSGYDLIFSEQGAKSKGLEHQSKALLLRHLKARETEVKSQQPRATEGNRGHSRSKNYVYYINIGFYRKGVERSRHICPSCDP